MRLPFVFLLSFLVLVACADTVKFSDPARIEFITIAQDSRFKDSTLALRFPFPQIACAVALAAPEMLSSIKDSAPRHTGRAEHPLPPSSVVGVGCTQMNAFFNVFPLFTMTS
jgi:hypothetical protein